MPSLLLPYTMMISKKQHLPASEVSWTGEGRHFSLVVDGLAFGTVQKRWRRWRSPRQCFDEKIYLFNQGPSSEIAILS